MFTAALAEVINTNLDSMKKCQGDLLCLKKDDETFLLKLFSEMVPAAKHAVYILPTGALEG